MHISKAFRSYLDLIVGSILLTLGIYLFVTPVHINFGGVIGLSQIITHFLKGVFPFSAKVDLTGLINFAINIPLFVFGLKILNWKFCFKTILSLIIQAVLLSILPPLKAPIVDDMMLNCIFGAMICGTGVGLALRSSGSCGGIDIACMCLVKKHPDFKAGQLSIYINAVLFAFCLFLFDLKTTLYSIVFVAILYTVSDRFHDQNINVAFLIITENEEVKKAIMEKTGRGVTHWQGKGAYTEHDKDILFCACNKYEISELRNIVETIDPHAFITLVEGPMIEGGFEKRL